MNVLVINAGSSSLKYQLMNPETGDVSAKGLCERIYIDGRLTHKVGDKKVVKDIPMPSHSEAIQAVLEILVDPVEGVIKSTDEIDAVGHRVLHGGMEFSESCIVNDDVIKAIKKFEGCAQTAYQDSGGVWTIGYGHTKGVKQGQVIDQMRADDYLVEDIAPIERLLNSIGINFRQEQFDALVSWIFNLGAGNFNSSTMKKYIVGDYTDEQITDQMVRWIFSGGKQLNGLKKRRVAEANMLAEESGFTPYSVMQQRMTYLHPRFGFRPKYVFNESVNRERLRFLVSKDMPLVTYSCLCKGAYEDPSRLPEEYDGGARLELIRNMAAEKGVSATALVVTWLVNLYRVEGMPTVIPLFASSRVDHFLENLNGADITLSDEELNALCKA